MKTGIEREMEMRIEKTGTETKMELRNIEEMEMG